MTFPPPPKDINSFQFRKWLELIGEQFSSAGAGPHTHPESDIVGLVADLAARELLANKNAANGYPGLSAGSKISGSQQTYGVTANTATEGNDVRFTAITGATASVASLGSELITNGTFATDLSGWTATNWTWDATGKALHTTGNVSPLSQSISVTSGITYLVSTRLSGSPINGFVALTLNGQAVTDYGTLETGQASGGGNPDPFYGTWTANATGSVTFAITPTSAFDGKYDDISIKAVSPGVSIFTYKDNIGSEVGSVRGTAALRNLGLGVDCFKQTTSGVDCTAFGRNALSQNVTGYTNVAFGPIPPWGLRP
jgi:hypothetical protein